MLRLLGHKLLLGMKLLRCDLLLLHVHLLLLLLLLLHGHWHAVAISTGRERAGRWLPRHDVQNVVENTE